MKRRKIVKKEEELTTTGKNILTFLSLQDIVLPEWRKISLNILSDEETILINNTVCGS